MEKTAAATSFVIQTQVPEAHVAELAEFLYQRLVLQRKPVLSNYQQTSHDGEHVLSFSMQNTQNTWFVNVEMNITRKIVVNVTQNGAAPAPEKVLTQIKDDIYMSVQLFEEMRRRRTIFFSWVEGAEVSEKSFLKKRRVLDRILFENMVFLFILLLIFSVFLFILLEPIFGIYVPFVLVAAQLLIVLAAPKIIARGADWQITEKKPNVHILMYTLPHGEGQAFRQKFGKDILLKMKMEIYQKTLATGKPIDCETAQDVFGKYGLTCIPENVVVKTVNVFGVVKKAADRFGLPVPKIVITNTIIPNAAATGPGPKHGTLLITTGILAQLGEDELLAVVGHEFSHLTGRDPLALFGLIASEYLLRFYVVLPLLLNFDVLWFYVYFILALGVIYFIAKFFEARADLVSAIRIGTPQELASSLRKIGFRRLGLEKSSSFRAQTWIGFDPHPPIYFRVERLEKLQPPVKIDYPFLTSMKDCIKGFFASF